MPTNNPTDVANSSIDPLLQAIKKRLPNVLSGISNRFNLNVKNLGAEKGTIGGVDVSCLEFGSVHIQRIVLENTTASLKCASSKLEKVRAVMRLKFKLRWELDFGWLGDKNGTADLGSIYFRVQLGDVHIPVLQDFHFAIPSVTVNDVSANLNPIYNFKLGGGSIKGVNLHDTQAPAGGFGLSNFGLGSADINNVVMEKGTKSKEVYIDEFSPDGNVVIPEVSATNADIPAIDIPDIHSTQAVGITALPDRRTLKIDLGLLDLELVIDPTLHLDIGVIHLEDAKLFAQVGNMSVQEISLPVKLSGITMKDMNLENVIVDRISVAHA